MLKDSCTVYCDIISPKRDAALAKIPNDEPIKKQIVDMTVKILRIGAVASFMPVLFAIRIKYRDNAKVYLDYLTLCEKFAFRVYRFAEKRANTGQTTLFKYGFELFKDVSTAQETYDKIRSLLLYYAPNDDFEAGTLEIGDDWYNWYGLKYLLYEYELHCAGKNPVLMDWVYLQKKDKQDSIEHILPQSPDKPYWKKRWKDEQIEKATHDIGNLVMTFDNSAYSNNGFDVKKGKPDKKGCYANSSLFSERELTGYDDWTYDSFIQRREKIAKWILTRWSIVSDKTLDIQIEEDNDFDEISESVQANLG